MSPRQELRAHLRRRLMPMPLAEPLTVVALLEREQGDAQLLHRVERADPEQLLRERADEPLGHPVALGLAHERGARRDPQELQLVLEVVADVLAAVIVPGQQSKRQAALVLQAMRAGTQLHGTELK